MKSLNNTASLANKSTTGRKRARKATDIRPKGRLPSLLKRQQLAKQIVAELSKDHPNPRCELVYHSPYQLLVSVVLSAQTTDKMVNRVMAPIYAEGFTPKDAVRLGEGGVLQLIKTIGLAPTKSKNVVRLSQILLDSYQGAVPTTRAELEALPGVGRKTANVILGEIFGHPTLAVDTHVFRVGMRLSLHRESSPEKAEQILLKVFDPQDLPMAHHLLILHGRYHCKALNPACESCRIRHLCASSTAAMSP